MAIDFPSHLKIGRYVPRAKVPSDNNADGVKRFTVTKRSDVFDAKFVLPRLESRCPAGLKQLVSMGAFGDQIRISPRPGGPLDGASEDMILQVGVRGVAVYSAANPGGDPLFEVGKESHARILNLNAQLREAGKKIQNVLDGFARANQEYGADFHQLAKAYRNDPGLRVDGDLAHEVSWLERVAEMKGLPDIIKHIPLPLSLLMLRFPPLDTSHPQHSPLGRRTEKHPPSMQNAAEPMGFGIGGLPLTTDMPFHLDGDRLREKPDLEGLVLLARSSREDVIAVQRLQNDAYRVLRVDRSNGAVRVEQLLDGLKDIRLECLSCNSTNNMFVASADGRKIFEYSLPHPVLGDWKSVRELQLPEGTVEVVQLGSDGVGPYALLKLEGERGMFGTKPGALGIFKLGSRVFGPRPIEMPAGMDPASVRFEEVSGGVGGRTLLVHGKVNGQPALFEIGYLSDGMQPVTLG